MATKLTKQQIIDLALRKGWELDKWGNLQKQIGDKEHRLKLSEISLRHEFKVHHEGTRYSKPNSGWIRLSSGYYKDLSITPEGKLIGLR